MTRFLHSHSAHVAFDTCPAKFELGQKSAAKGAEAEELRFGKAFHRFAELYTSHCVEQHRWSDLAVLPEFLRRALEDTQLSTRFFDELYLLVKQFAQSYPIDPNLSIAREGGVALDADLNIVPWTDDLEYDSPNFRRKASLAIFRTKHDHVMLDPVEKLLTVDDFKTDLHIPSASEVMDPTSRWWKQGHLGAWSARRAFFPPAELVRFRFVFVRYTNQTGKFITRTIDLTPDDLDRYQEIFLERMTFIETRKEFPAIAGEHCRQCPYLKTACPIRNEIVLDTPEEIASVYLHSRVIQEERREWLKQITEADGPITIGGVQLGLFETEETRALDVAKALEALEKEGFENPALLLDVSITKLKNVLDPDQFTRVIAAATTADTEVVFNLHQKKDALVALAKQLGINPNSEKGKAKTIAQLAYELTKVTPKEAA